jgi:hypothetical protein
VNEPPARSVSPPSGRPPPGTATLPDSTELDLVSLSQEICRRYLAEFPDEVERYGPPGAAWCIHDNQHILNWAALSLSWYVDLEKEIAWLARVLEARGFPLERLRRDLEIAAEVVEHEAGERVAALAAALRSAARFVASKPSFLDTRGGP